MRRSGGRNGWRTRLALLPLTIALSVGAFGCASSPAGPPGTPAQPTPGVAPEVAPEVAPDFAPDTATEAAPALAPGVDAARPTGDLWIHLLDVGQGDAILIEEPSGRRVLIDAGPAGRVADTLQAMGVEELDLFIASHNHADHIGGAAVVIRTIPVRFVMDNGVPHITLTYQRMLEAMREHDVPLLEPEGRTVQFGEATLHILPPPGDPALGHNDNSVGVILRFGRFQAMFAGDAEGHLWHHWLETLPEPLPAVDLHKASHHGSRNGDIAEALAVLQPRVVLIGAGRNNRFGHPHPEALALYEEVGAQVFSTAERGRIGVRVQPDGSFQVGEGPLFPPAGPEPDEEPQELCLDVNTASVLELQAIIHLDTVRSQLLVSLREERPFTSLDDLVRVPGIGPARVRDIRDQGLACVGLGGR